MSGDAQSVHDIEESRVFHVVECAPKVDVADVDVSGMDRSVFHSGNEGRVAVEDAPHAAKSVMCVPKETIVFCPFAANSFKDRGPEF